MLNDCSCKEPCTILHPNMLRLYKRLQTKDNEFGLLEIYLGETRPYLEGIHLTDNLTGRTIQEQFFDNLYCPCGKLFLTKDQLTDLTHLAKLSIKSVYDYLDKIKNEIIKFPLEVKPNAK